jgi:sorbitol-specific phosphotransferase system component IIA
MWTRTRIQAVVVAMAIAVTAAAQQAPVLIAWSAGSPAATNTVGEVAVQGTITLPKGTALNGKSVTVSVWPSGNQVVTGTLALQNIVTKDGKTTANFNGTVPAGFPGQLCNVTVEAKVESGKTALVIRTQPATVTPKAPAKGCDGPPDGADF